MLRRVGYHWYACVNGYHWYACVSGYHLYACVNVVCLAFFHALDAEIEKLTALIALKHIDAVIWEASLVVEDLLWLFQVSICMGEN